MNVGTLKHKTRTRPNGTGTAYKRGKTWVARVVVGWKLMPDGHAVPIWRTKGGFPTKREALEHCQVLLKAPQETRKLLTMREIYEAWLPTHTGKVSEPTMRSYRAAWNHFAPIHDVTFASLDLDDLQTCVDECGKGRSTLNNMKVLAKLLYRYALPRHQSDMDYAEYISVSGSHGTHPAFSPAQVQIFWEAVGTVRGAEDILCLIYTGMRPTEMLSLKQDDIQDNIIYGGIKTDAGKDRAVPISPKILPFFHRKMHKNNLYLWENSVGTRMTSQQFRANIFFPALAELGMQPVPTKENPPVYTPYSCRHTFANLLKDAAGSDKDKAALMGHEDYTTTKRMYQSADLQHLREIIDQL